MKEDILLGCHQDLTSGVIILTFLIRSHMATIGQVRPRPYLSSQVTHLVDQAAARPVTPGSNNQSPSTPESATASPLSFVLPTDSISVDKQVSALRTHY